MPPEKKKRSATAMVATHPPVPGGTLRLVEEIARERGLPIWYLAGLRRAKGWAQGKQVTAAEFDAAAAAFDARPQGGGKL